ncbi:MAG: hypothetical protein KIT83_19795, partial [Bryobacterales bacterium]|nr:hypothetical protein [Bryobacterales bacterium]
MAVETRLIYNPEAGGLRRGGERLLREALELLAGHGIVARLESTQGPNTAGEIARRLVEAEGVSRLFVAGGDGTLNEVLNGIVGLPVEVGILPAGTANVMANELKIGRWHQALSSVGAWKPLRIPAGRLEFPNGSRRHFLMMAGAGFDARMVYSVDPEL